MYRVLFRPLYPRFRLSCSFISFSSWQGTAQGPHLGSGQRRKLDGEVAVACSHLAAQLQDRGIFRVRGLV